MMAKLLPLILAGILTTVLHEAQADLPTGPAVDVLVTPNGPMASCKTTKAVRSVVFQSIKSKKGIVYNRAYTHPEILNCFGSSQPSAATFRDCVNAAAVAGHSTLSFDGTTCSTYNATVPSHACADQKAAAANYIAIYQANPPLVKPNFENFKVLTVAATVTADTNNNFDVTWTTDDGGCNYPGFFVSFSGQENYVETTSSQTTIENVPGCETDVIVSFGLPTGEKFGTTAQTVITIEPEPQIMWPFNEVPGYTLEANLFPNKTIIVSYDVSPGCGSFTEFSITFFIKYPDESSEMPSLVFPISEPKGTIEIGTADVPDICVTSVFMVWYTQTTDGGPVMDSRGFLLSFDELSNPDLFPFEVVGSDLVIHWSTDDLTPYDVCGVLPGTNLKFVSGFGDTYMAPISDGTVTFPGLAPSLPTVIDVIDDSLGVFLIQLFVCPDCP